MLNALTPPPPPKIRGAALAPTPLYQQIGDPLDGNFKLYMNHCHRCPVNIFVINMLNSLFKLLILFDMINEYN